MSLRLICHAAITGLLLLCSPFAASGAEFTMKIGFATINDQNQQWANWYKEAVETGQQRSDRGADLPRQPTRPRPAPD